MGALDNLIRAYSIRDRRQAQADDLAARQMNQLVTLRNNRLEGFKYTVGKMTDLYFKADNNPALQMSLQKQMGDLKASFKADPLIKGSPIVEVIDALVEAGPLSTMKQNLDRYNALNPEPRPPDENADPMEKGFYQYSMDVRRKQIAKIMGVESAPGPNVYSAGEDHFLKVGKDGTPLLYSKEDLQWKQMAEKYDLTVSQVIADKGKIYGKGTFERVVNGQKETYRVAQYDMFSGSNIAEDEQKDIVSSKTVNPGGDKAFPPSVRKLLTSFTNRGLTGDIGTQAIVRRAWQRIGEIEGTRRKDMTEDERLELNRAKIEFLNSPQGLGNFSEGYYFSWLPPKDYFDNLEFATHLFFGGPLAIAYKYRNDEHPFMFPMKGDAGTILPLKARREDIYEPVLNVKGETIPLVGGGIKQRVVGNLLMNDEGQALTETGDIIPGGPAGWVEYCKRMNGTLEEENTKKKEAK